MRKFLRSLLERCYRFYGAIVGLRVHILYKFAYRRLLKLNNLPNRAVDGEKDYVKKWRVLYPLVNVEDYRLFSHYLPVNANFVPEAISHNVVEAIMNPPYMRPYFSDKNMFEKILPREFLPVTVIRDINGFLYDRDYDPLSDGKFDFSTLPKTVSKLICKPTVNSCSGNKVLLFIRERNDFKQVRNDNQEVLLSIPILKEIYKQNFIVQECLQQSDFMAQFNSTSVNTIRLFAYRSVITNRAVVPAAIMRIGKTGSYIDNSHAGGISIGISSEGKLNSYAIDQYGEKFCRYNDIDFQNGHFQIPNYRSVLEFAREISEQIQHLRFLNLDVMINSEGQPRLIEYNLDGMSTWLYQFSVGPAYGKYTDEIIAYCRQHRKEIERVKIMK